MSSLSFFPIDEKTKQKNLGQYFISRRDLGAIDDYVYKHKILIQ